MTIPSIRPFVAAGVSTALACTAANAGKSYLSAGIEYSRGDYGEPSDTKSIYSFIGFKHVEGPWSFRITVPFIYSSGPTAVPGDDSDPFFTGLGDQSSGGLGDVSFGVSRSFELEDDSLYLDVAGRLRFPTGDEDKGLSTGSLNGSLTTTLTKVWDAFELYGELGRRFNGDHRGFHRADSWTASAGGSYTTEEKMEFGASIDWREATSEFSQDPVELYVYAAMPLTEDLRMTAYATTGLAGDAADYSFGVSFSLRLD